MKDIMYKNIEEILSKEINVDFRSSLQNIFKKEALFDENICDLNPENLEKLVKKLIELDFKDSLDFIDFAIKDWKDTNIGQSSDHMRIRCDYIEEVLGWLLMNCFDSNTGFIKNADSESDRIKKDYDKISLTYMGKTSFEAELVYSRILKNCARFKLYDDSDLRGANEIHCKILELGPDSEQYFSELEKLVFREVYKIPIDKIKDIKLNKDKLEQLDTKIRQRIKKGDNYYLTINKEELEKFNLSDWNKFFLQGLPSLSVFILKSDHEKKLFSMPDNSIIGILHDILFELDSIKEAI